MFFVWALIVTWYVVLFPWKRHAHHVIFVEEQQLLLESEFAASWHIPDPYFHVRNFVLPKNKSTFHAHAQEDMFLGISAQCVKFVHDSRTGWFLSLLRCRGAKRL